MRVRRVVGLVLACGLAAGSLAGCQEAEPTPKMPESASSSPSVTESAEPKRESAEEFIRRWQAVSDRMQLTGKASEYRAMTPNCMDCQAFARRVQAVYDEGGRAEFAGSTITSVVRVEKNPPTFDVSKDVPVTVVHHADGSIEEFPPGKPILRVTLGRSQGAWVVNRFGFLSQ